jgi:hypothetical protein
MKATSTWLQLPFVDKLHKWTVFALDLAAVVDVYMNRRFACVKSIRACSNLYLRNVFTSHTLFTPETLPHQFAFFLAKVNSCLCVARCFSFRWIDAFTRNDAY